MPLFACITEDCVTFKTWKRVEIEEKRMQLKIVEVKLVRETFIQTLTQEAKAFSEHVKRLQFQQLGANKESLPKTHMIVQMDFAENYSCRYANESTCAFQKHTAVTLHSVVFYLNPNSQKLHW